MGPPAQMSGADSAGQLTGKSGPVASRFPRAVVRSKIGCVHWTRSGQIFFFFLFFCKTKKNKRLNRTKYPKGGAVAQ